MIPIPEFTKLFQPYAKKINVEGLQSWLYAEAKKKNVAEDVAETAMATTFLELGRGKVFPKDGCECGCGLTNRHSALAHYMRAMMFELQTAVQQSRVKILEKKVGKQVKIYVSYHGRFKRVIRHLIHWKLSPVIRGIKWILKHVRVGESTQAQVQPQQ